MPIGVGVRGFFETTLESWEKGVAILRGPPPEGEITARGPILKPGPGAPTTVSVPGIFDVVKVGVPDPTDPAVIANRRAVFQAIRSSPEPEYAAAFGEIMTAIDNVRDVLALGMIAGRITLAVSGAAEVLASGGSIVLGRLVLAGVLVAPEAPLLAVGVGELGAVGALTAVGSVLLPVLAVVTAAFLVAEIAHWMAGFAIVGYAGLCRGPAEAAFAAIPALIWGRGLKGNVSKLSRMNPWSVAHEVREVRAGNVATFVGREYVEAGRATAVLWGHGWLLGAIVGGLTAGAFALQRISNGDAVKWDATRFNVIPQASEEAKLGFWRALGPTLQDAVRSKLGRSPIPGSNIALRAAQAAAECLWSLPNLFWAIDRMRPIDFVQVLSANLLALDILQPYLYGRDWLGFATYLKNDGLPAPDIWAPWTQTYVRENGGDPGQRQAWALPGAPTFLHIDQIDGAFTAAVDQKLQAWFTKYDGWIEAGLCGALLDAIVQRLYFMVTEHPDGLRQSAVGYWKVLFSLAESNRQVLATYGDAVVTAFFEAALAQMTREARNSLIPRELDALAASVGMRLLVIEPPHVAAAPVGAP